MTERILGSGGSNEGLGSLRILRSFLKVVGERWLGCGELSNELEDSRWTLG